MLYIINYESFIIDSNNIDYDKKNIMFHLYMLKNNSSI